MKTHKIFLVIFILSLASGSSFAQNSGKKYFITGQVLDVNSKPVSGATVLVDNKSTDIVTDEKGNYKIKVKTDAQVLSVFTLSGGLISEEIKGRVLINFKFEATISQKVEPQKENTENEEVNIGYGTAQKKNMATNVATIDGKKNKYATYQNMYEMIRGEVPSVQVINEQIRIRGLGTFHGNSDPLILVDGVETKLSTIDPRMVKTISILTGSDASIYGSKAANGVIMITLIGK